MQIVKILSFLLSVVVCVEALSPTVVVFGGAGRIGTAIATHLLLRAPETEIILVGRRQSAMDAIDEVLKVNPEGKVSYSQVDTIWRESKALTSLVDKADCLIHAAGPYLNQEPTPLRLAIASERCKAYVDISDPLPYLETSLLMDSDAKKSKTTALVAAGAFPGMSNVLATEACSKLDGAVNDVRFNYFTAGLGGSGVVNLYITNLGFGEPMVQYENGVLRFFMALSGLLLGKVDFFLPIANNKGNDLAKERVGTQTVFAWPFPEAATTAKVLNARGNSYAAMGTAPDIWNVMLGVLVAVVPRPWWAKDKFSKFMADFSQPLVLASDALLKWTGVGETHAIRVDVTTGRDGKDGGVSIVQAHDSFRDCVGQSCAEFALDILENTDIPGVFLPEQRYSEQGDRDRILAKLTSTPGTFCYTGPVSLEKGAPLPTDWERAISQANRDEARLQGS